MANISLLEWEKKFLNHEFDLPFTKVQIEAGWYDWFCNDKALPNKTNSLGKKVLQLIQSKKINKETMYVFFKNNCTGSGKLYDSFSFCDIESGDVIFWVTPKSGHTGKAEVVAAPDFKNPAAEGSWKDVKNYFNS